MGVTSRAKALLLRVLPPAAVQSLRERVSLVRRPTRPRTLASDLFPFRRDGGWRTHFELLNVPALIDPDHMASVPYVARFYFFDENGEFFQQWQTENCGISRRTISIGELLEVSAPARGTICCFHEVYLPQLEAKGAFLAERGYAGYSKGAKSMVRGYVHGNLDAIGLDDSGRLSCLGKGFWLRRGEYRLQHRLEGPATYELCIVNSSSVPEAIEVEVLPEDGAARTVTRVVPSRGSLWTMCELDSGQRARVLVRSKLNLPRPVVFRVEQESFDVFHG